MGSSIRNAWRAPACMVASNTARFSTSVTPEGTHTTTRGLGCQGKRFTRVLLMKYRSIASVTSKSAMTPSLSGRMATMLPGVRPSIRLASMPTASTRFVSRSTATTEGSMSTIPRPRTDTSVFAVPRSTAMSPPHELKNISTSDTVAVSPFGAARVHRRCRRCRRRMPKPTHDLSWPGRSFAMRPAV